jgi:dTDP-4-dehydrorhamnose 3,5-epimerase
LGANLKAELIDLEFVMAEGGGILKIIKKSSGYFQGFGELYFSQISYGAFRGWKRHQEMHSLLFVVQGAVSFHFFNEDKSCYTLELTEGIMEQKAVMIPPGSNFGFKSTSSDGAVVANFANIEHRTNEVFRPELDEHSCGWGK